MHRSTQPKRNGKTSSSVDSKTKQDASSSRRVEGVYIEVHNRNATKNCAAYSLFYKKTKPLQPARAIIFIFSCGRSHVLLHLLVRCYVARWLLPQKFRLLLLCRNALNHLVHWRLPLFLFLNKVPRSRDIKNHFSSYLLFHTPSDLSSVGLTCTLEFLPCFQFSVLELHASYLYLPSFTPLLSQQLLLGLVPFDCLLKLRPFHLAVRSVNTFSCLCRRVSHLPKTRRLFLGLKHGFLR